MVHLVSADMSRPNVVLILADDLGWGDIQANNQESAMTTPRMDGIAVDGVNFTDAHSPSSLCSPTRYGLLTGRYPWRSWLKTHTLRGYERPLIGADRPTLGTLMQGHGYSTAAVGKWHLGMEFTHLTSISEVNSINRGIDFDAEILDGPTHHGFDEYFGVSANSSWPPAVYIRDNRFAANPDTADQSDPNIIANWKHVQDRFTEEAVGFIERSAETDAPFFFYFPLNAPHEPIVPNDDFRGTTGLGRYGDFVAQVDWTVGQVLDALDRVGARDNTLVIVTSDNGSFMQHLPNHVDDQTVSHSILGYRVETHQSNGHWSEGKGSILEGGHRIPFLLQWPAVLGAGLSIDTTVSLTDLYATLADLLGEEMKPGVAPDSVSLLPMLLGNSATRGTPVVHHSRFGDLAIRDDRWKLILTETPKLYDLEEDPKETNDLYRRHPDVVGRLKGSMTQIRSTEEGALSDNATLRSLRIAGLEVGPLDPEVRTYTATVDHEATTVEVLAIPTETDARVSMGTANLRLLYGNPGRGWVEVALGSHTTTITFSVTAPDESATALYTVTITRVIRVTGTAQVGETLRVDRSSIRDAQGLTNPGYTYQWIRKDGNEDNDVVGATGATYVLQPADEGKTIWVRVNFTDDHGESEMRFSDPTAPVAARANNPAIGLPTISGTVRIGETLTADTSAIADPDGLDNAVFSYQWGASGLGIPGATGPTYTISEEDETHHIQVIVTFTDDEGNNESLKSQPTAPVSTGNSPAMGAPTITGTAQVGETLTADTSAIADEDGLDNVDYAYQWVRNDGTDDTDVAGATNDTYTLVEGDQGKTVKVRVTFTDDKANEESLTSTATAPISAANSPATGAPTITGIVQVTETLTADTSGIADADGLTGVSYSYQWVRNDGTDDTDIAGAKNGTYTLLEGDRGKTVKVRVTFTDDSGNSETLTSASTAQVASAPQEEEEEEPETPEPPGQPTGLSATLNGDGSITLTWTAPQGDVDGYQILRRRPQQGELQMEAHLDNTGTTATTWTDADTSLDTRYVYRVKARNGDLLSEWSNFARVDK